jgi:predicted site-specific integrase-resolvase
LQAEATTERKGGEQLVLSESGSGLKAPLHQVWRLLKRVCEDNAGKVAIPYEDRFTRFGQEHMETLCICSSAARTVLEADERTTPEQEWTKDL